MSAFTVTLKGQVVTLMRLEPDISKTVGEMEMLFSNNR